MARIFLNKPIRSRKAALDVSINSIVVIVFAITMLGLGLAFIKSKFSEISKTVTFSAPDIPATADSPIILPYDTLSVNRGIKADISINFYNNEDHLIAASVIPAIACNGITFTSSDIVAVGQPVEVGSKATYKITLQVPKAAATGKVPCTMSIDTTSKQFFMQVE